MSDESGLRFLAEIAQADPLMATWALDQMDRLAERANRRSKNEKDATIRATPPIVRNESE